MDDIKETVLKERNVVSFREVHEELERESMFLKKGHDVQGYKQKAEFLNGAGFRNSIAAKLYGSISENSHMIDEYDRRYHGQYKFILKPQLERLCEKYNLFVREPRHFLGDIPENNIKEMMNFQVYLSDLAAPQFSEWDIRRIFRNKGNKDFSFSNLPSYANSWELRSAWENDGPRKQEEIAIICDYLKDVGLMDENYNMGLVGNNPLNGIKVPINQLSEYGFENVISIAAVEDLFDPEAFEKSKARILGRAELNALNNVDLDPIVLCETRHGCIVITAWGDEANDELIVNPNKN